MTVTCKELFKLMVLNLIQHNQDMVKSYAYYQVSYKKWYSKIDFLSWIWPGENDFWKNMKFKKEKVNDN